MKNFLNFTAKNLIRIGYEPIIINNNWSNIDENTTELCFIKRKGAVINIVILINADKEANPLSRYDHLTECISSQFEKNTKILSLGIAAGDGLTPSFTESEAFIPDADIMKIHWAVDIKNNNIIYQKDAPTKLDGIESILKSAKNSASASAVSVTEYSDVKKSFIRTHKTILTYALIAANILIFLIMALDGGNGSIHTLLKYGALSSAHVADGQWYRIFSCMFIHINTVHLLSNMLSLYIFGTRCEKYYGHVRFIAAYIVSGLCSSVLSLLFSGGAVSAGASGAIMGLMSSALIYTLVNKIPMDGLDVYTFMFFSVINLGFGFVYEGVDNFGHIGGFIGGLIVGLIIALYDKKKVENNEKSV